MAGGLVFIVLSLFVYFDLIVPLHQNIRSMRNQIYTREAFIKKQEAAIQQFQELAAARENQKDLEATINLALPNTKDASPALAQLYGIAQNVRIAPQSFTISLASAGGGVRRSTSTIQTKPLGTLTFQVQINGTYEDFKSFLRGLETNLRIFDLQTLSLASNPAQRNLFNFQMAVVTHYQNFQDQR